MKQDSVHMGPPPYIALAAIGLLVSASIAQSEADGSRNDTGTDQAAHTRPAVVIDEAWFVERIHRENEAGARDADHLDVRSLIDLRNGRLRLVFCPEEG